MQVGTAVYDFNLASAGGGRRLLRTCRCGPVTGNRRDRQPSPRYEFRVRGRLGEMMLGAFPGLQEETEGEDTLLRGLLPDQAALHGVLAEIEALGLELLEVRRLPGDTSDRGKSPEPSDADSPRRD
jgi:hypothetical protein